MCGKCYWIGIKVVIVFLYFQYFLYYECCSVIGYIFIYKNNVVGFFQGFQDDMFEVEGKQGLCIY